MKILSTLFILLFSIVVTASGRLNDSLPQPANFLISGCQPPKTEEPVTTKEVKINLRCGGTFLNQDNPLLVIDGVLHEFNEMNKLNPNDIVSIDILKDASATALYGYRAARGVILITTKSALVKTFIIKDFLTGERVPLASVCFISKSDSIRTMANDIGVVMTDKLKPGVQYKMIASSAGYKTLSVAVKKGGQEVLLEKDVKECAAVVVVGYPPCVCRRLNTTTCTKTSKCTMNAGKDTGYVYPDFSPVSEKKNDLSVYPNPAQRNHIVNLEFSHDQNEILQLSVIGLNGKLVLQQSQKIAKGLNRFSITADARWAAGIYIVQLRDERGAIIKNEKLVIQ
jgi:TonB-dependent SusC/RagA subfamily outer membrane receptor